MVKKRRVHSVRTLRSKVLSEQDFKCAACGFQGFRHGDFELDHITPLSKGGGWERSNLQALCPDCHREKTRNENERTHQERVDRVVNEDLVHMMGAMWHSLPYFICQSPQCVTVERPKRLTWVQDNKRFVCHDCWVKHVEQNPFTPDKVKITLQDMWTQIFPNDHFFINAHKFRTGS